MSQDSYRPPPPARPRPPAPPPPAPTASAGPARARLLVVLPGGVTCRSWDDFLAVSAQRWDELRDHLVSGRLGAAVARAGYSERVPDPDSRSSPDQRLDDWLGSLPTTRQASPELDVQPSRIDLDASGELGPVRLRIANVGYRLLRFRVMVEPFDATWLVLPPSLDGIEMIAVEEATIDLAVVPPRRPRRPLTATIRVESNGGERLIPVSIRSSGGSRADQPAPGRSAWWVGAAVGLVGRPLVLLLDRLVPSGLPLGPTWLVLGILGLGVGVWLVGRQAGLVDRLFGALAGSLGGFLAADAAILASEAMPTAPWWWSMVAWSVLGGLAAAATGLAAPQVREAPR